jgi:hypothetical protein
MCPELQTFVKISLPLCRFPVFRRDNLLPHSLRLNYLCSTFGYLSIILIDAPALVLCPANFLFQKLGTARVYMCICPEPRQAPAYNRSPSSLQHLADIAPLTELLCTHTFGSDASQVCGTQQQFCGVSSHG